MIILDTNVVSEPLRRNGDPSVVLWLDQQAADTLFITTTSLSELFLGVALLPAGRRKAALSSALSDTLRRLFGPRILSFDLAAAEAYAAIVSAARQAGRAIATADGQIAAIAITKGYAVATRDADPFEDAGVPVIDPWRP